MSLMTEGRVYELTFWSLLGQHSRTMTFHPEQDGGGGTGNGSGSAPSLTAIAIARIRAYGKPGYTYRYSLYDIGPDEPVPDLADGHERTHLVSGTHTVTFS